MNDPRQPNPPMPSLPGMPGGPGVTITIPNSIAKLVQMGQAKESPLSPSDKKMVGRYTETKMLSDAANRKTEELRKQYEESKANATRVDGGLEVLESLLADRQLELADEFDKWQAEANAKMEEARKAAQAAMTRQPSPPDKKPATADIREVKPGETPEA